MNGEREEGLGLTLAKQSINLSEVITFISETKPLFFH